MVSSCLNCLSFKEVRWNLKLPYNRGEAKSHGRFLFNVAPCVKVSLEPRQDQCRLCKNPPSDFSSDATSAMLSGAGPPIGHWPHPCNWFFSYFLNALASLDSMMLFINRKYTVIDRKDTVLNRRQKVMQVCK